MCRAPLDLALAALLRRTLITRRPSLRSPCTSPPVSLRLDELVSLPAYLPALSNDCAGIDATLRSRILTNPWLTDPVDQAVLVTAITDMLSTYKQVPNLALISPDNVTSINTHVTNMVAGSNHWTGSTKIGTSWTNSVVDSNTKVWNTSEYLCHEYQRQTNSVLANLFIVDAGIFPGMPTGNPTGAILVAAENAVAKILALAGGP